MEHRLSQLREVELKILHNIDKNKSSSGLVSDGLQPVSALLTQTIQDLIHDTESLVRRSKCSCALKPTDD